MHLINACHGATRGSLSTWMAISNMVNHMSWFGQLYPSQDNWCEREGKKEVDQFKRDQLHVHYSKYRVSLRPSCARIIHAVIEQSLLLSFQNRFGATELADKLT